MRISGDLPIVLVQVAAAEDELLVRQLLQWRAYTRRRGLELDLVILDERAGEAGERLRAELQTGVASEMLGKPGGIFALDARSGSRPMMRCCSRQPHGLCSAVDAGPWPISSTIASAATSPAARTRLRKLDCN